MFNIHREELDWGGRKLVLEGNVQGNKPEEKIIRLQAEIAKAPKEIVPLLETIQAHWHWQYFQQNRWRFMQRTQTAAPPGDDFTTWDLPRILAEIDKQFQKVLASADVLKKIPIAEYNDLLEKGTAPDAYRSSRISTGGAQLPCGTVLVRRTPLVAEPCADRRYLPLSARVTPMTSAMSDSASVLYNLCLFIWSLITSRGTADNRRDNLLRLLRTASAVPPESASRNSAV
jgi:hypothetical protein